MCVRAGVCVRAFGHTYACVSVCGWGEVMDCLAEPLDNFWNDTSMVQSSIRTCLFMYCSIFKTDSFEKMSLPTCIVWSIKNIFYIY